MSILNLEGAYENELAATGEFNPQAPRTALRLPSGQRVVFPTEMLLHALSNPGAASAPPLTEGTPGPVDAAAAPQAPVQASTGVAQAPGTASTGSVPGETVIPLLEEQLEVSKREVETARIRVRRETEERVQNVSVNLTDIRWEIEHIPVEQKIDTAPEIRQVGDTIVFPLVEERMVVTRELWLREEVHVHRVKTTTEKTADFPVKRDILVEERANTNTPG